MAALIIEIPSRHGNLYHKVDKPMVRAGRALDNDIILSDPAVSPYHFVVRQNAAGAYELRSLSDENGIRIGRRQVDEALSLNQLPLEFEAGRTRIRILNSSQPVAPTRLLSCRYGRHCLFGHWGWALLMFAVFFVLSAVNNYLSTPQTLTWDSYWSDQVVIATAALGLSIGLLIINRITSQRWDYPSSLSFVSLVLIVALLLDLLMRFADYFFTSPLPGFSINLAWSMILMPLALGWFLVRLNHGATLSSIIFVIVILTPAVYLQVKEVFARYDLLGSFSKQAYYNNSLYPLDYRMQETISIEQFEEISKRLVAPNPPKD